MTQTVKLPRPYSEKTEQERSEVQVETIDNELCVTGLPDDDTLVFVGSCPNSRFYVVHRPREDPDNYRLHIGLESQLREARVRRVLNDRGTESTLFFYTLNETLGRLNLPANMGPAPTDSYRNVNVSLERLL